MIERFLKIKKKHKVLDTTVPAPLLQRAAGLEPVHPAGFPMSVPAEPGPDQINNTTQVDKLS